MTLRQTENRQHFARGSASTRMPRCVLLAGCDDRSTSTPLSTPSCRSPAINTRRRLRRRKAELAWLAPLGLAFPGESFLSPLIGSPGKGGGMIDGVQNGGAHGYSGYREVRTRLLVFLLLRKRRCGLVPSRLRLDRRRPLKIYKWCRIKSKRRGERRASFSMLTLEQGAKRIRNQGSHT